MAEEEGEKSYRHSKHRKEYRDRKELVHDAYKGIHHKDSYAGNDRYPGNPVKYTTELLTLSDKDRKENHLNDSYNHLNFVYELLSRDDIKWPDDKSKKKIAQATVDRAARLLYQPKDRVGRKLPPSETMGLIYDLKKDFDVKPRRPKKNLEGTVAAVGLIGGLLFLSPTITGNVIGNASVGVSSFVGALLFLFGIVGAWRWVRNR